MSFQNNKATLEIEGYDVISKLYSNTEIAQISNCIDIVENEGNCFIKKKNLFAIRQLINCVPKLPSLLFNANLKSLLSTLSDSKLFLTKAIYFDKPSESNWFVGYHQDLSISVDKKIPLTTI